MQGAYQQTAYPAQQYQVWEHHVAGDSAKATAGFNRQDYRIHCYVSYALQRHLVEKRKKKGKQKSRLFCTPLSHCRNLISPEPARGCKTEKLCIVLTQEQGREGGSSPLLLMTDEEHPDVPAISVSGKGADGSEKSAVT